jgi:hypothetical protein
VRLVENALSRPPEFNKKTVELLAKRSGNMCSNPDCRRITSASNLNPGKATVIGEAAHIFGARSTSARLDLGMTDQLRSASANGIWLCTGCHKRIDDDPSRYTAEVLFRWREIHEMYTVNLMDNKTDAIKLEIEMQSLEAFSGFPPIARRILLDKPVFWEGELTKVLLEHLLQPLHERHQELRANMFLPDTFVVSEGDETKYIRRKMTEAVRIISSLKALYTEELIPSWGLPGESGDPKRILAVCRLIERTVGKMVDWESELEGVFLEDEDYSDVFNTLKGAIGRQLEEVLKINDLVSDVVDKVRKMKKGDTLNIDYTMVFSLPDDFNEKFDAAFRDMLEKKQRD